MTYMCASLVGVKGVAGYLWYNEWKLRLGSWVAWGDQ
jgi:hypothetical protein